MTTNNFDEIYDDESIPYVSLLRPAKAIPISKNTLNQNNEIVSVSSSIIEDDTIIPIEPVIEKKISPLNKFLLKKKHKFTEEIDMVKLKTLIDNYNPETMGLMYSKNSNKRCSKEASLTILKLMYNNRLETDEIIYKQTKSSPQGRFFSETHSLQGISRKIRHTIAKDIYYDIDIKNCHPVILVWYCESKGIECNWIKYYISNREDCFNDLMPILNVSKDDAKIGLLSIINGGSGFENMAAVEKSLPNWFVCYYHQVNDIHEAIIKLNPEFLKQVIEKKGKDYYNIGGSVANKILCQYENIILLHMAYFCQKNKVEVGSLCFDGLMVYKKSIRDLESFLKQMCDFVKKKTSIDVLIVEKTMDENIDITNMKPDYSIARYKPEYNQIKELSIIDSSSYLNMKSEFELYHFKNVDSGTYYELYKDKNEFRVRSQAKLKESYCHMSYLTFTKSSWIEVSFIDKWIKDKDIRKYDRVDLYPPPLKCPETHFNLWTGFEIENTKITEDDEKELKDDFQIVLNHFRLLFSDTDTDDDLNYQYVMNYFANMIQKPGIKPEVAIILKSLEGLGKELAYNFFVRIFGEKYCFITQNIEQYIFGEFNPFCEGKILFAFDEMNIKVSKGIEEKIKAFITSKNITINNKGLSPYQTGNFNHCLFFTNRDLPVPVSDSDRRFNCVDASKKHVPKIEYYIKLGDLLNNDKIIRMLFDYFMKIDISQFNVKKIPSSEFANDLKTLSRSPEINFIIDFFSTTDVLQIVARELFEEFISWLVCNNTTENRYNTTKIGFGIKLKNMRIDSFQSKAMKINSKTETVYTWDKQLVTEWLYKKNYIHIPLLR